MQDNDNICGNTPSLLLNYNNVYLYIMRLVPYERGDIGLSSSDSYLATTSRATYGP